MNLASIPPHPMCRSSICWRGTGCASVAEPSRGLILLPTRRAARALAEAFLRQRGGRPMLLPRITALGALDEAPLALAGALDLPPAVGRRERLAVLSRLILALPPSRRAGARHRRSRLDAGRRTGVADGRGRARGDPAARRRSPAPRRGRLCRALAGRRCEFLRHRHRAWPAWLAEQGLMNPAARQVALLRGAGARLGRSSPPDDAGLGRRHRRPRIPAVAGLLRTVARLPNGLVVLPGLDHTLDDDTWARWTTAHPQAALRASAGRPRRNARRRAGLGRAAIGPARRTLSQALLPAPRWPHGARPRRPIRPDLFRLDASRPAGGSGRHRADPARRAGGPGRRAALVTPDRALAGRVAGRAAALGRGRRRQRRRAARPTRRRPCSCACSPARSPSGWRRCRCWRC